MKSEQGVIPQLNQALRDQLTAINQYFLHARMFKDWGFTKLGEQEYQESVDEMKHADAVVERVLFLEGLPNMQDMGKLMIGENVRECLECDLKLEQMAVPVLREGIAYCESQGDYVSRDLMASILSSEEEHIDWLETQLELIDKVGLENYCQSQM